MGHAHTPTQTQVPGSQLWLTGSLCQELPAMRLLALSLWGAWAWNDHGPLDAQRWVTPPRWVCRFLCVFFVGGDPQNGWGCCWFLFETTKQIVPPNKMRRAYGFLRKDVTRNGFSMGLSPLTLGAATTAVKHKICFLVSHLPKSCCLQGITWISPQNPVGVRQGRPELIGTLSKLVELGENAIV